jgi:hypothetical protein
VSSPTADPRVSYAPGFDFAGFQRIVQNSELNEYQGQIAPKNIGRSPRWNKLDLAFRQQVPFFFGGKIELTADVENVLNLLNSDWGTIRQVAFPYYGTLVNVRCLTTPGGTTFATVSQPCAQFQYSNQSGTTVREPTRGVNLNGSLWSVRFGARVRF